MNDLFEKGKAKNSYAQLGQLEVPIFRIDIDINPI
jgi:hypothetical protein